MKPFLFFILFLFPHLIFAQTSSEHPIYLNKDSTKGKWLLLENWRFTTVDDSRHAQKNWDDSQWEIVNPKFEMEEDTSRVYPGIGWFRHYIHIDSSLVNVPINIGMKHNGASEIYLNGELLQKVGTINLKGTSKYQSLKSPINVIVFKDTGVQVFAVRYENKCAKEFYEKYNEEYGGFVLSMQQANADIRSQAVINDNFIFFPMLIFGVFIALAFVHFLLFLFYRTAMYNLYFGLFNLSMALLSLIVYLKFNSTDPIVEMIAASAVFYVMCIWTFSITAFVNDLFAKKNKKKRFKIMAGLCLTILLLNFFYQDIAYSAISIMFMVVAIEAFVILIKAMIRKEQGAFIIGFGFLFLTFFIVTVIAVAMFSRGHINLNNFGFGRTIIIATAIIAVISVPISISAYLPWRFAVVNKDLEKQLHQVKELSEIALRQEQEKKQLLETQNERLEKEVAQRTEEIKQEKQRSDDLLLNILPSEIAEELKHKGESKAHKYDEVSVLFTDFVNFTQVSEQLGVDELLNELNINFTAFDRIMEKHGLEKIKTIGDAYLAVCGLPIPNSRHAQNAVNAAMDILEFVQNRRKEVPYGLDIRIGINSGSLIAGIIGVKKFAYDIWGDTVNTAARMEQSSVPGKINVSDNTYQLIKEEYRCDYRGKLNVKNKGEMDMYFVEGMKD